MGTFNVRVPSRGTLEGVFADIPQGIKGFLRDGFNLLTKLHENDITEVFGVVAESIQLGYGVGETGLASKIGITDSEARAVLASASLFASILSTRDVTAEEFVRAAIQAQVLEDTHKDSALAFCKLVVRQRASLKEAIEQAGLADVVLPSLSTFETTVDLRLNVDKGKIVATVPVALIHLDTDAQGQEIWVQLTKRQVAKILAELQEALQTMEEAERWASGTKRSSE